MYLVPPMDDEPPPEYVAFVAGHLAALRRETDRLVGGDFEAGHLYMDVLADVAGHWRRLTWWGWLAHKDAPMEYMSRRLASRTKQWRDEQIYEVDIRVLRTQPYMPLRGPGPTLAVRKADVLDDTVRVGAGPYADAGIAWVQAYRKQQWHRVGRLIATGILLVGGMIQYMSWLSTLTS
ncbi:hypothetical protein ACFQS1_23465 [Paractinoplanes rhizophilus]|jgi:hypothetical protein|uniref:Uncharacterized protein n=1 Tax=Paractinoplanes rhizophilus TaxID=1416877 RepID=A0ABW2HW77_9ACTN|nr:hypothetical protein [Actinoplanes sp.]